MKTEIKGKELEAFLNPTEDDKALSKIRVFPKWHLINQAYITLRALAPQLLVETKEDNEPTK